MMTAFRQIPDPLQKQTLIRFGLGVVFILLMSILHFISRDIFIWLPCAGAAIFFIASAFALFRRAVLGEYVVVSGVCQHVELTAVKRRAKFIILKTDEHNVQVTLHSRARKISVGTVVDLYLAKSTPIYVRDNVQILNNYLAIDIRGGNNNAQHE